ncbi:sterile alpha motif domain containing 1a [Aplochiton taeniatus]
MSETKFREWILDTIDSLRSRKARPDLERICRMVRRRHGSEPERTCAELEKLIQEQTVLKVNYKGSISYRNAAKVQRRSRKKDDTLNRRTVVVEEASHSDLSNGDSALGPTDQDDDMEADVAMAIDTDSNVEEEGADESLDGQNSISPAPNSEYTTVQGASSILAFSAPCSPSGSRHGPSPGLSPGPDSLSASKSNGRSSSLPPSSPRALGPSDWASESAFCPAERQQHPGMHIDKGAFKTSMLMQEVGSSPSAQSSMVKKEEGAGKAAVLFISDQLVPDCGPTAVDETRKVSDGRPQTLPLPSDNGATFKKKIEVSSYIMAQDSVLNGVENGEIYLKKEKMSQNLLQWSVADVASYFSAAGFPEQAVAFRSQEIDGKSLLLMQRSDVLTGLSIRLGPALKIYERHIKVLQRTHFLEEDNV